MFGRGCIGFVGWRGLVGSVFIKQSQVAANINNESTKYLFLSSTYRRLVKFLIGVYNVKKTNDVKALLKCKAIVSMQGSDYTDITLSNLRNLNWTGYWIDAASSLRRQLNVCVVLDPVNSRTIKSSIESGKKSFVGGNCTVSLMLMVLHRLIRRSNMKWMFVTTFQSVSGAGSNYVKGLLLQMAFLSRARFRDVLNSSIQVRIGDPSVSESVVGSIVPWIDEETNKLGTSKEEQKGFIETNRILGLPMIPNVGGVCIRVGVLRCHSQSFLIKVEKSMCFGCAADIIQSTSRWVKLLPNIKAYSRQLLTPEHIAGSLVVAIGRLKKLPFNSGLLSMFTVGDQLLWGAVEPIKRTLKLFCNMVSN
ncbi:aspartate-semialdehyde dehydrogenase [Candidatus Tremblaya phenacola]|uniref:Aspartate-semialdehyde dehydrogenase n=1 Tax=Candidatus Tremblayella phenacoccinincola TaxID=1010676 RepID=A0A2G0V7B1_9PROT|nr:aspartate-semialdehyde dehydrogenase [Candidatus Tremblaya phenacola]PHN16360.1 Aspartate-semialdehyde dehydrogenase [Candidatus Tremblaya phenacola]